MKLEIIEKSTGASSVELFLKGDLTIYSVKLLNDKLKAFLKKFQKIEIDLANIAKIDTAGFQILVSSLKSGKNIKLKKPGEEVKKIFSFYGEKI